jgi:hypothetical protein
MHAQAAVKLDADSLEQYTTDRCPSSAAEPNCKHTLLHIQSYQAAHQQHSRRNAAHAIANTHSANTFAAHTSRTREANARLTRLNKPSEIRSQLEINQLSTGIYLASIDRIAKRMTVTDANSASNIKAKQTASNEHNRWSHFAKGQGRLCIEPEPHQSAPQQSCSNRSRLILNKQE